VDGGLFFSVFQGKHFRGRSGRPGKERARCWRRERAAPRRGLPPMHWNGMVSSVKEAALLRDAVSRAPALQRDTAGKVRDDGTESYEDVMEAHRQHWEKNAGRAAGQHPHRDAGMGPLAALPDGCAVALPAQRVSVHARDGGRGNTPARFGDPAARRESGVAQRDPTTARDLSSTRERMDEWAATLLPEAQDGTAPLEAIRTVFGAAEKAP
jgi:hypothetical protein